MADLKQADKNPEKQLWKQLEDVHAGMLGVEGSHHHMQPMSHNIDKDGHRLWFFTSRDTDLLEEVGAGKHAHFCVIGDKHDYHACLSGTLRENKDAAKIDEYWNDMVGAWFSGKDDPRLTLLEMDLDEAAIWASSGNPIKFGWEILKSKDSDHTPDVGVHTKVQFS